MRLLLFHPGLMQTTCQDCKKYLYDPKTWKLQTYRAGAEHKKLPCLRPVGVPTPCDTCPRGSPTRERASQLNRRSVGVLQLYLQVRATGGACLDAGMRRNGVLMRDLSLIDELFRIKERIAASEQIGAQIALVFATAMK